MTRKLVQTLSGSGVIFAGDQSLRTTHYHLEVFSELAPNASPAIVIEGNVDIAGIAEAVVLAGPGVLTLQIEDGRRVAFTLTSTAGRIHALSGLESGTTSFRPLENG